MFFKGKPTKKQQDPLVNQLIASVRGIRANDFDFVIKMMSDDPTWEKAVQSEDFSKIIMAYIGMLDGNDERVQKAFEKIIELAEEVDSSNFRLFVQLNKAEHLVQCRKILQYRLASAMLNGKAKELADDMLELLLREPASLVNIGC